MISLFDSYITFLVKLNKSFCHFKEDINQIAKVTREHSKKSEQIQNRLKGIEQNQQVIEARYIKKYTEY